MSTLDEKGVGLVVDLETLAQTLETEGQYNVAKLVRAAQASLIRSAAHEHVLPSAKEPLAREVENVAGQLEAIMQDDSLTKILRAGAAAVAQGHLPLITESPDPYVCRTCGYVELEPPQGNCPSCGAHPHTFQWFPPAYSLQTSDPTQLNDWLDRSLKQVKRLVDGLQVEDLAPESADGEWGLRDVLTHLRDAQGVLDFRVNLLLESENPTIESVAVFEWSADDSTRPPSIMEVFEAYQSSRLKTLEKLHAMPPAAWWRQGKHEEFGRVNLMQQVSFFTNHELSHLPQLQALVESLTGT
jgi:hypothetical protein